MGPIKDFVAHGALVLQGPTLHLMVVVGARAECVPVVRTERFRRQQMLVNAQLGPYVRLRISTTPSMAQTRLTKNVHFVRQGIGTSV